MGNRRRIEQRLIGEVVVDELAYEANKSSANARKVLDKSEHIEVEIWCDKHYYNRAQFGDRNGLRKGIDEETVKELVIKSLPNLLYYSFKVAGFVFVNFGSNTRKFRVVIQEVKEGGLLNVVTEFHHLARNKYQVTVITAMQENDFTINVGQYALEIDGEVAHLRKHSGNEIKEINTFSK